MYHANIAGMLKSQFVYQRARLHVNPYADSCIGNFFINSLCAVFYCDCKMFTHGMNQSFNMTVKIMFVCYELKKIVKRGHWHALTLSKSPYRIVYIGLIDN